MNFKLDRCSRALFLQFDINIDIDITTTMASSSTPPHPFRSSTGSQKSSSDDYLSPDRDPYAPRLPLGMTAPPQVASEAYIEQYKLALDHQRHAFNSERVLWNIERSGLLEKITSLEDRLRRHQALPVGRQSTPTKSSTSDSSTMGSHAGLSGITRATSTSGEFWRAPRSLSENLNQPISLSRPSVIDPDIEKHFEGIKFRPVSVATRHASAPISTNLGPPAKTLSSSHSSSHESPRGLQLPPVQEEPDNLTKDAGHTPLARSVPGLDGDASAMESDLPTPSHAEQERPPLEKRASTVKIPSERSESYFPPPADEYDQDPELRGQLGLKNDASSDNRFLSELNSRLAQVAEPPTSSTASRTASKPPESDAIEHDTLDHSDPEPKLRIKRSLNFGTQLGGNFRPQP